MISAKEAHSLTKLFGVNTFEQELTRVSDIIKKTAKDGLASCTINLPSCPDKAKSILESNGYKVVKQNNSILIISWNHVSN